MLPASYTPADLSRTRRSLLRRRAAHRQRFFRNQRRRRLESRHRPRDICPVRVRNLQRCIDRRVSDRFFRRPDRHRGDRRRTRRNLNRRRRAHQSSCTSKTQQQHEGAENHRREPQPQKIVFADIAKAAAVSQRTFGARDPFTAVTTKRRFVKHSGNVSYACGRLE